MRIPDGLAGTWAGPETGRPLDMGDGERRAAREKEVCPFLRLCTDRGPGTPRAKVSRPISKGCTLRPSGQLLQ